MNSPSATRNQSGTISVVILLGLIIAVLASAAFSFDYSHGLVVKEQLQNATDAGALAGVVELARENVTPLDIARAESYAKYVTAANRVENESVSNASSGTEVSVFINAATVPRTITVTSLKNTPTMFARVIGWNSIPISSTSTASAKKNLIQIKPNQLFPLAVSLNHRPEKGPQKDISLQDTTNSTQTFTVVLNPDKNKNSSWLKNWTGTANPLLTVGQDCLSMNGVSASQVKTLSPGDTIYTPVILGGPPFNDSRPIVGVIGIEITKVNFPLQVEGIIINRLILRGTPGNPEINGLDIDGTNFLSTHAPWQVSLSE